MSVSDRAQSLLEQRIVLTRVLTAIFIAWITVFTIAFHSIGQTTLAGISVVWWLGTWLTFWLLARGRHMLARNWVLTWVQVVGFVVCAMLGKEARFHNGFFCVLPVPLLMFGAGDRKSIGWNLGLATVFYILLEWAPFSFAPALSDEAIRTCRILIDTAAFSILILSIIYFHQIGARAEAQLADAYVKASRSEKMAALGEMAGGVAHEINTPLTTIHLLVEQLQGLAKQSVVDPKDVRQAAALIEKTTQRIATIVRGMRSFSRDGSKDQAGVTLVSQVVEDTLGLCTERFKNKGVALDVDMGPSGLTFEVRAVEISQVLLNLLNNALDAVSPVVGAPIQTHPWVRVKVEASGPDVEIRVTDCGLGIPDEIQKKLFQPFFTTKDVGNGTGLGLSVSFGIVRDHGGTIAVDRFSSNTSFVVRLPRRRAAAVA